MLLEMEQHSGLMSLNMSPFQMSPQNSPQGGAGNNAPGQSQQQQQQQQQQQSQTHQQYGSSSYCAQSPTGSFGQPRSAQMGSQHNGQQQQAQSAQSPMTSFESAFYESTSLEERCPMCGDKMSGTYPYHVLTCNTCKNYFKQSTTPCNSKKVYTVMYSPTGPGGGGGGNAAGGGGGNSNAATSLGSLVDGQSSASTSYMTASPSHTGAGNNNNSSSNNNNNSSNSNGHSTNPSQQQLHQQHHGTSSNSSNNSSPTTNSTTNNNNNNSSSNNNNNNGSASVLAAGLCHPSLSVSAAAAGLGVSVVAAGSSADFSDTKDSIEELCPVCGDKVSGYHYGLLTCESCKGFFKRTVQNKKVYTCVAERTCHIDKTQRKRCPYCRFQKCLEVGMKLEAVRADRMRGGRNKFGPMYKRDRARKLQMIRQRQLALQTLGRVDTASYPNTVAPLFHIKQEIQIPQVSSLTSSPDSSPSPAAVAAGLVGGNGNGNNPAGSGGVSGSGQHGLIAPSTQAMSSAGSAGGGMHHLNGAGSAAGLDKHWAANSTTSSSPKGFATGAGNNGAFSGGADQQQQQHGGAGSQQQQQQQSQSQQQQQTHGGMHPSVAQHHQGAGVQTVSGHPQAGGTAKSSPLIRDFVQTVDDNEWQTALFSLLQSQTYNQCEVDLFELMCKVLDQNLFSQVDWARNSCFFKDLKVDDQMKLLQHSWSDMLVLDHLHQRMHNSLPDEITLTNGQKFDLLCLGLLGVPSLADLFHGLSSTLQELKFDFHDYICMKFLMLLNHDVRGLANRKHVQEGHEQVQRALLDYTLTTYPTVPDKFNKLMSVLPEIHVVAARGEEHLYQKHCNGGAPTQTLLMEMLHAKRK
ncbi:nuclear hormone receptor FTZ-F1 isoform X2 [Trichogramma pretiosum]|uniref:nuclear hormone receptor FTZ-F1 isoform X2 n=1 Tax=Trichogramma pretiosum TaxID=7493 RepID=UPI0006C9DDA7|nr:nuclear hormone receptor FTZ-F1 isoform X2 [Trichogramma pretiosum]